MCCASLRLPIVLTLQIYFCRSTQSTFTLLSKLRITLQQKIVFFEFFYAVTGRNFYAVTGSNFGAVTGSNFYAVTGSNFYAVTGSNFGAVIESNFTLYIYICIYFFSHKNQWHTSLVYTSIYTQVWINII